MSRASGYSLWFGGVSSETMNVSLISFDAIPHAEMKAKALDIPGRSGYLMTTDPAYKPITIKATMRLTKTADRAAVSAWLSGQGELRWGKVPTYMWKATVQKGYDFKPYLPGQYMLDEFSVQFLCQPFHYIWPQTTITSPANNAKITNSGTIEAEPLIQITGSGNITIGFRDYSASAGDISENILTVTGLSGSITIDTEARLAYDGTTNLTSLLSGDWPIIGTGDQKFLRTGTFTALTIQPNWRCI